nr:lamin tail domain-containing protein [bacterium]
HINTEGTNTDTELFTGLSGNMGNSSGFVALFTSSTHGSSTIIDYVEYGAGGQTWESAAADAGIWSAGDFVATVEEGFSMNLDPDGVDTNSSGDWASCEPSMLEINCQALPTPTPTNTAGPGTPTMTPEPTATPGVRLGIVINEVFFDPEGADTGFEYVELMNTAPEPLLLTGYDLKADDADYFTIPDFTLASGAYVVIHVNTSGTNTQTDLYTGPSGNMGNSSGFIALFSDVTHSSGTIVDYIEYGEGGQTWESAAVDAGIWTAGDYIPVESLEGFSLNLCPDGNDQDRSDNWQQDITSAGTENTCNQPTPTPTTTATPEPTRTPTPTPTPRPTVEPVIRLGGYGETDYQYNSGGMVQILAWVTDPESDVARVWVTLGGEWVTDLYDDGLHGDFGAGDGFYGYELTAPPAIDTLPDGPLRLQMRIHAVDARGYSSHIWPLFTVDPEHGYSYRSAPAWWDIQAMEDSGDRAPGDPRPYIYMAGFMESRLSEAEGGDFIFLAVTTGPLPIAYVELYYLGLPTGVYLLDDGMNHDFSAGDGVFGMHFSVGPGVLPAGDYPLQLRAVDVNGNKSDLWPYLTLSE